MKLKVSNTLYILAALFLVIGVALNWFQVKNNITDTLAKARAEKKRKAEERKEEMKEQEKEIDIEIKEIIKK